MAEEWVKIRWEKDSRYYEVHLHQDLFDSWILTRVWGRRDSAQGRVMHTAVSDYSEGMKKLTEVATTREKRGYQKIENKCG